MAHRRTRATHVRRGDTERPPEQADGKLSLGPVVINSLIQWGKGLGQGTVWRGRPAGGQGFSEKGWLSPCRIQEVEKGRWAAGRAPGVQGEARPGGGKAPDVPLRWWGHLP